jgi:hypothetical protein
VGALRRLVAPARGPGPGGSLTGVDQRAAHGSLPGLGARADAVTINRRIALPAVLARRPLAVLLAACLAGGFLSLLLPSTNTYDPWAWILWGREILHGDLNTVSGPSWKPLPVLFTIPFSLAGDAAPDLWLGVARAGGLLAVALVFIVAHRLAPPPYRWLAGGTAAVGLLLSSYYVRTIALGNSEGLLIAAVLGAVERHLAGRRDQAFMLGVAAALLRPETWPFLGLYTVWLWFAEPRTRRLAVGLWILVAVLWFAPELWGSGSLMRSAERANSPNANSPAFSSHPAKAVFNEGRTMLPDILKVGVFLALVGAGAALARRRLAQWPAAVVVLALAAGGAVWTAVIAVLTVHGYSGNPRYLMPAIGLACVVGAVGWAWLAAQGDALLARLGAGSRGIARARVAVVVVVLGVLVPFLAPRLDNQHRLASQLRYQARITDDLNAAVAAVGGARQVRACGQASTGNYEITALAWRLDVHIHAVSFSAVTPGLVFQARATRGAPATPGIPPAHPPYRPIDRTGVWRVFGAACANGTALPVPRA